MVYKTVLARVLVIVILGIALSVAPAHATQSIRLATNNWAPFISENEPYNGFIPHLVTEIYASVGINVKYGFFTWARCMVLTKEGHWDGSLAWYYSKPRAESLLFSAPFWSTKYMLFYRKDHTFDWTTWSDLADVEIGLVKGFYYGSQVAALEKDKTLSIQRVASKEINIRKLLGGRIDVLADTIYSLSTMMDRKFKPQQAQMLTYNPKSFYDGELHIVFGKKNKRSEELVALFNQGLKKLKQSGLYDQHVQAFKAGRNVLIQPKTLPKLTRGKSNAGL